MPERHNVSLDTSIISEIILDMIDDFCSHLHNTPPSLRELAKTTDSSGKWALDSLITYQAASYVATMFNLPKEQEASVLFEETSLPAWAQIISKHIECNQVDIVFYTSGTTGKRKVISHSWQNLVDEAQTWIEYIGKISHIYINVPKHHIYGFIWGGIIPSMIKIGVTDYRQSLISQAPLMPNSLIVTVPHASRLLRLIEPHNIQASNVVLSTAPCEHDLLSSLSNMGFNNVYHVYGSTETGGLGIKNQDQMFFKLRPDLRSQHGHVYLNDTLLPVQDTLAFSSPDLFAVKGRLDNAIQINGYNVNIAELEHNIKQLENVQDTGVRVTSKNTTEYLEVFIQVNKTECIDSVSEQVILNNNKVLSPQYLHITTNSIRNNIGKLLSNISK